MDLLLLADHLRSLRESGRSRAGRRPAIRLAGAGALLAAACAACLIAVMLHAAFSHPLGEEAGAAPAYEMKEEGNEIPVHRPSR